MNVQSTHISESIDVLNDHLIQVAQVGEWADLMGYQNPKKFSRKFLRYYEVRPCKMLVMVRLKSIYQHLKKAEYSNFQIARHHSLPDEKALNKFVNYHLGCCPRQLKRMPENQFKEELEKFGSEIR
jgi:methylphosphotriester-DNA--protein-cysteine methyltransferase